MFYVIYDTLWFIIIHVACYKGMDLFFRDYSQALKPIAGIDANSFNYNLENDAKTKHGDIFWSSVPFSFLILTINPVIHSIVYLIFSLMISVVDLNRILFYILLFKIAIRFNIFSKRMEGANKNDLLIALQIFFTIVSYTDVTSIIPTLFQLADEFTGLGFFVLDRLLDTHKSLFRGDTKIQSFLYKFKVFFVANKTKLYWGKFLFMMSLFLYNFIYVASLSHPLETAFCYYSVARVAQIYVEDLRAKKA